MPSLREEFLADEKEKKEAAAKQKQEGADAALAALAADLKPKIKACMASGMKELRLTVDVENPNDLLKLPAYKDLHAACAAQDVDMKIAASPCGDGRTVIGVDFMCGYKLSIHKNKFGFVENPPPAAPEEKKEPEQEAKRESGAEGNSRRVTERRPKFY